MVSEDDQRTEGVDFEALEPVLDDVSYPIGSEELVERHGDVELERTNAEPITLRELFDGMGENTFESPKGVHSMVMSMMPEESVGPSNYSDRGGATPTETDAAQSARDQTSDDAEGDAAADRDAGTDGEHEEPSADTGE